MESELPSSVEVDLLGTISGDDGVALSSHATPRHGMSIARRRSVPIKSVASSTPVGFAIDSDVASSWPL